LSDVELRILRFCHEERSVSEIINFTGMNLDYIRKELIPKLIKKGFLALTIPDKPRSPHQKYILTEAAKKHVKGK
jgi:ATP-dependent DNA helicase RecG